MRFILVLIFMGYGFNLMAQKEKGRSLFFGVNVGTKIANNTFIGVGCTIASRNLKIGSSCFISSGSVLFNNLQSKTKIIGNPARKIL